MRLSRYIRFSSPEQAKGDSHRRQSEGTPALCAEYKWTLDTTLTLRDLGISAFKSKNATHGALSGFLKAVESGTVKPRSVLIVESLDRLSRAEILTALNLFTGILQADIQIYTVMDRRLYTAESVNANPTDLIISITVMMRAHEESMTKSKRGLARWSEKRKNASTMPMTAKIPAWIELDRTTRTFSLVPGKAETIRRIVALVTAGHGITSIVRTLNAEGTPVVSRAEKVMQWEISAVRWIVNNRALIGEFQPCLDQRKPIGEAIKDYYPAVIDSDTYYRMQAVIQVRRRTIKAGKVGKTVGNLFGSILHDGTDGETTMVLAQKGDGLKYVVNRKVKAGTAKGMRFSYHALEFHFLQWVSELELRTTAETSFAAVVEGKLAMLRQKMDQLESAMKQADASSFPRMISMLAGFERDETTLLAELEVEKAKEHRPEHSTGEIAALARTMHDLPEIEKLDIRNRLRLVISAVVRRIDLFIHARKQTRLAIVAVTLSTGDRRTFYIQTQKGKTPMSASTGLAYETTTDMGDTTAFAEAIFDQNPQTPKEFCIAIGRATVTTA